MTAEEPLGFDITSLFSQVRQAQADAAAQVVEGRSGAGAVRVRVTGSMEFREILIDPSVVDPGDVEMLQDLVLAAVRDAMEKAGALATSTIGQVAGGLMGGLGLPDLGLGGPPGDSPPAG